MLHYFTSSVPFSQIRHNDLPAYVEEGYGGKPIEAWPVYSFFCKYLKGNKQEAHEEFEKWYRVQLEKYHTVPKSKGGMHRGSLYSLIEKRSGVSFDEADEQVIKLIIRERVAQRFALLDGIQRHGYDPSIERVDGVRKHGYVYLKGGHHRAAALRALGEQYLPGVLVFPHQIIYNSLTLIRRIKDHATFR